MKGRAVTVVNCVGAGQWGPNLIRNFATHPNCRVAVVSDLSAERLQLVRRNNPTVGRTTTDPMEAVTDPAADAVVIATPLHTHFELTKAALEAGKHALVEKPLCSNLKQAEHLVALARSKSRVLCVGHVFLFNAGIRAIREMLTKNELGKVYYASCVRTNLGPFRADANPLWDLASHDISILNYWFGAAPEQASATGRSFLNPRVEDVATACFTYPGGQVGYVHTSWLNPRKVREITLVGEAGMVGWNDMDLVEPVRVYHKSVDVEQPLQYSDTFGAFRMSIRNGNVVIPPVAGGEPLAAECSHFLDCIQGRCPEPINSGASSLPVLRALEAAQQSLRNDGRAVPLAPAGPEETGGR
jgi:predicted dehydrogenase